jgi:taurine dioxygenase
VELSALSPEDVAVLRGLLAEHGVLLFADQSLDDDAFVAFLRSFGELTFTKGETHVDGHPDLNVVSNVGRATPPKSAFHVDTSYVRDPPAYTALRAVQTPRARGRDAVHQPIPRLRNAARRRPHGSWTAAPSRTSSRASSSRPDDETSAEHPGHLSNGGKTANKPSSNTG